MTKKTHITCTGSCTIILHTTISCIKRTNWYCLSCLYPAQFDSRRARIANCCPFSFCSFFLFFFFFSPPYKNVLKRPSLIYRPCVALRLLGCCSSSAQGALLAQPDCQIPSQFRRKLLERLTYSCPSAQHVFGTEK